ncbi:MAG: hypothetical protein IKA17_07070 [Clostridia bacterium]|nr:hypothetical protein [Clostridia bacterium]
MIKKTSKELNEKFVELMERCFFHPSRDNMYPTKEIKEIALQAMKNLWQTESISFEVIKFSNAEIQYIILKKLMPEHIDFAIDEFMHCNRLDGVEILSYLIFVKALTNNNLMSLFAKHDIEHGLINEKGGAV